VRVVFRHFPLGFHDRAEPAAIAADCANEQGKFWEYHDKLFANQQKLDDASLKQYATELALDTEKFNACVDSAKYKAEVQQDAKDGQAVGVTGTPAFFVNGRFLSGAQPFDAFKAIIDDELSRG
jgi:protein-disulfide isomerase